MTVRLLTGDCREFMTTLPEASIDAVVTDPPYGLEFMGKEWDRPWAVSASNSVGYAGRADLHLPAHRDNRNANCRTCGGRQRGVKRCECATPQWDRSPQSDMLEFQAWSESWAIEALRALKPGGHLLAFGGTRTFHRLTCAIEDAGFEVRDCVMWLYGSGFPKSHNLTCAWDGWGTALKPAWEPIILARKPLVGTVASNVERYGTGALNIDGCRIETSKAISSGGATGWGGSLGGLNPVRSEQHVLGRWPANLILDEEAAELLDASVGTLKSGRLDGSRITAPNQTYGARPKELKGVYEASSGGPSRFFYTAKASHAERNAGLEGMEERVASVGNHEAAGRDGSNPSNYTGGKRRQVELGLPATEPRANHHPTVKPLALMRYLVRLITPPDGTVLDPFMGSGSTGIACVHEGFDFIGMEESEEYVEIARRRIAHAQGPMFAAVDVK